MEDQKVTPAEVAPTFFESEIQDFINRFHKKQKVAKWQAWFLRLLYVFASSGVALVGVMGIGIMGLEGTKASGVLGVLLTLILGIDNQLAVTEKAESYRLVWAQSQSYLSRYRRAATPDLKMLEYDKFVTFRELSDGASINPDLGGQQKKG